MRNLTTKIEALPAYTKNFSLGNNALIGMDIDLLIPSYERSYTSSMPLLIVSPTCPVCHDLLDTTIKKGTKKFVCYVDASNKKDYAKFEEKFKGKIEFFPMVNSRLINEFVYYYPFVIWVDRNGVVKKTSIKLN